MTSADGTTTSGGSLEERVQRIEDRIAIQELIARYCYTLDLRDLDGMLDCFTDDVELRRSDGSFVTGKDRLREYYLDNLVGMGPTLHAPYGNLVVEFPTASTARSRHYGYAEHAVDDELVVAMMTYNHDYRREAGGWRISSRVVDFWYFCRATDLLAHYATRARYWWRGAAPAQLPMAAPTWQSFVATTLPADPTVVP